MYVHVVEKKQRFRGVQVHVNFKFTSLQSATFVKGSAHTLLHIHSHVLCITQLLLMVGLKILWVA